MKIFKPSLYPKLRYIQIRYKADFTVAYRMLKSDVELITTVELGGILRSRVRRSLATVTLLPIGHGYGLKTLQPLKSTQLL